MRPRRRQPTRLLCPWDSPGKNTGVGCHFLLQCMKVKSLSRVQLFATPWTAAYQAPPSMGFSRQEYWSGVPLPFPVWSLFGIFPDIFILLIASLIFLWSESIPLYDFCSFKFKMCFMTWNMVSLGKYSVSLSRICILPLLEEVVYKYQLDPVGWWCFSVLLIFHLLNLSITDKGMLKVSNYHSESNLFLLTVLSVFGYCISKLSR